MAEVNYKEGLSQDQKQSISDLVRLKPLSKWNDTDWGNYNYATGQGTANRSFTRLAEFLPASQTDEISVDESAPKVAGGVGDSGAKLKLIEDATSDVALNEIDQLKMDLLGMFEKQRQEDIKLEESAKEKALTNLEDARETSLADLQDRAAEKFKLDEKVKELEQYKLQLNNIREEERINDINIQNKPIHAAIVRGQRALNQQYYAARASTIQANVAVTAEMYNLAADRANKYYNALATDRAETISYYEKLLDMARDNIINLKNDERENISTMINVLDVASQREQEEKDKILSLMLDPQTANAFKNSGADLSMSFDEIVKRISPLLGAEYAADRLAKSSKTSTGTQFKFDSDSYNKLLGAGFTSTDIANIQQNIRGGYSIEDIIRASTSIEGPTGKVTEMSDAQKTALRTSFTGASPEIDDEVVNVLISGAVDSDGNLDISKIPAADRVEVIKRATELDMFDQEDNETKTFLDRFGFFSKFKNLNPFSNR